ncbi:MAG: molybdenum cofactor synthesis domain [Ilumatobacteraceae bacterium]|nr:molybdenum cofactor synthesis domain [Ilumatobacteraceae bacterium]
MDRLSTSIFEARELVLAECRPLPATTVDLADAIGCVLATDIVAAENVPPFANSALDGYAVLAADVAVVPVDLPVVAEIAAGAVADHPLQPGEAMRIMTGAPVPVGADAIVLVERTERLDGGERVRIHETVRPGQAVRGAGDDIAAGTTVFTAGDVVRPAVAGVLASVNVRAVPVFPRAHVAVLSTGDELIDDGGPLGPGQIRESNKTMLVALVAECGAVPVDLGVIRDDEAALEGVLREAAETCDVIITSGGVSMGDYDVVKAVLSRIAEMQWLEIAIKPAKPFAFGRLRNSSGHDIPVLGLPGNPVSSLVSFELLARPALRQMMGHTGSLLRQAVLAVADADLRRTVDGKVHYQRVHGAFGDDGRYHVSAGGPQGSHQLAASAVASALAELPDGDGVRAGDDVLVYLLSS